MCKSVLAFTALLTLPFLGSAAADEGTEQRNKRAQKVMTTLKMLGIANPKLNSLVQEASSHMEKDGFFYVADQKMDDGRLALRFACRGIPKLQQLQLSYVPKDTHYAFTASTRGVMLNYHYDFK